MARWIERRFARCLTLARHELTPSGQILLWLAAGITGAVLLALVLYGVIGPPPTPPGPRVVMPAGVSGPLAPRTQGEPFRVLLVGTSLTARGDWPDRLQQALSECSLAQVEVIRAP